MKVSSSIRILTNYILVCFKLTSESDLNSVTNTCICYNKTHLWTYSHKYSN